MHTTHALRRGNRAFLIAAALALLVSLLMPALSPHAVYGAQITDRDVTISTSQTSATAVDWDFDFTLPTAGEVEGIRFQFCDNPLGTCVRPGLIDVSGVGAGDVAQTGWSGGTAFADQGSDENDCQDATNSTFEVCVERTDTTSESGARQLDLSDITNPTSNVTVYVRITTYDDADFENGDLVDDGVVAAATVNQLTLTATVQENLVFCVGDTDADSADDCTDITGSTVDIGILDFTAVNESSVDGAVGDRNGYVMVRTNAASGVSIDYYGGDGSGDLTSGANTIAPHATESAIVAGNSEWGMEVASTGVDTSNGATSNLSLDTNFNDATEDTVYWGATDTASDNIASSSLPVDDEMLVLDFMASQNLTQLPGVYSTTITFVATPTF